MWGVDCFENSLFGHVLVNPEMKRPVFFLRVCLRRLPACLPAGGIERRRTLGKRLKTQEVVPIGYCDAPCP